MGHPVVNNRSRLLIYMLIWIVVAIPYIIFMYSYFKLDVWVAIADSLVSVIWFSLLGLLIWYFVRYNPFDKRKYENVIINHFVAAIIVVLVWLALIYYSLYKIPFEQDYDSFFRETFWWRVFNGIMLYLVTMMVYYTIFYFQDQQERMEREASLNTSIKDAELNALKAQINPHFLFNSLNSVNALITLEPERARSMVLNLSDYLRYSIKSDIKEKTPFKKELENLHRYIEIEKMRFDDRLVYDEQIDSTCAHIPVPNMILQPIIENAVKHGTTASGRPEAINLKASCENGSLKVQIENTYDKDGASKRGTGIGMKNTQERMRLTYNRNDLFQFNKSNDKFTVSLIFPAV